MPWPPDIAPDLPAPRDDEPESLRQDIADELADHLHSAYVRELHTTRDETQAQQNVLDRFGNPSHIARKLWFDWMWEKIMSQRINVALMCVMTLVSLAALAMGWVVVSEGREANRALVQQGRELNEAIVAALGRLPARSETQASPEWNPVKVRLVQETPDGPPAVGFSVSLQSVSQNTPLLLQETSGPTGIVDFGLIRPGQCYLNISAPWGESTARQFYVKPGTSREELVLCPRAQLPLAELTFDAVLPDDLRDRGLFVAASILQSSRIVDGIPWSQQGAIGMGGMGAGLLAAPISLAARRNPWAWVCP